MRLPIRSFCIAAAILFAATPAAEADSEPVDVELVLAVDVSLSMSPAELEIQRRGYAAALTDPGVLQAVADGAYGRIAITYFEWAGVSSQNVVVPWTAISTAQDAENVARKLTAAIPKSARRTSISAALVFGGDLFAESGFRGMKRVIDISGDGPNNQGAPVQSARDALVAQGIVINGLPLMTTGGMLTPYDVADLDRYYSDCVIGGPGAFMIPVNDWSQFPEAIRRKLVLELAQNPEGGTPSGLPVIKAATRPPSDCMVGEKVWRNRYWQWDAR